MTTESDERLWTTLGRLEEKIDAVLETSKDTNKETRSRLGRLENWRRNVTLISLLPATFITFVVSWVWGSNE